MKKNFMNLNRVLKYFFEPNKRNILFFLLLGISAAFLFDRGFALFSLAQADNAVLIKIDSATSAKPGDSIDLNLSIDPSGSSKQPASIQWDINYNSGQISSITWKGDGQAIKDAGKSASCSALSAGVFRCVVFGLNTNTITKGTLGTVTVKLSNAATGPVIDLKFSGLSASDPDGSALPMSASDGTITLQTVVNNTPPTVAIVSPAAGVTASGSNVILSATASAASGSISNVKFYLDKADKSQKHPIHLVLRQRDVQIKVATGEKVMKHEWDNQNQVVKDELMYNTAALINLHTVQYLTNSQYVAEDIQEFSDHHHYKLHTGL